MGHVVLVFTDVVRSTDMYGALGDLMALEIVKKQFDVLFASFSTWGRVKTIGDSVMAAFGSPSAALEAAAESLLEINRLSNQYECTDLRIRIGIHVSPALIVPLNGINDYFGQSVNKAARIEARAEQRSCLVSREVFDSDPGAQRVYERIISTDYFEEIKEQAQILKGVTETLITK